MTTLRVETVSYATAGFGDMLTHDLAYGVPGLGRFRVNVFHQRGNPAMVLRYITAEMPTFEELGLPPVLKDVAMTKRGLVIFVGATGSGKSTSLAAMVDYRNENSYGHIITVEDPVEFVHRHKNCIITQREVGVDTDSWHAALKNTLRQAPDVILIGEIRDRESMEYAITFAGTGHLCVATLHANNAAETLDRIINMFPRDQHSQIFLDLSQYLKAIISQRLVPGVNGKRVAAVEVMLNTPHISEIILKGDISGVKEAFKNTKEPGMQSFDQAFSTSAGTALVPMLIRTASRSSSRVSPTIAPRACGSQCGAPRPANAGTM